MKRVVAREHQRRGLYGQDGVGSFGSEFSYLQSHVHVLCILVHEMCVLRSTCARSNAFSQFKRESDHVDAWMGALAVLRCISWSSPSLAAGHTTVRPEEERQPLEATSSNRGIPHQTVCNMSCETEESQSIVPVVVAMDVEMCNGGAADDDMQTADAGRL